MANLKHEEQASIGATHGRTQMRCSCLFFFRCPSGASPAANGFALAPRRHIQFSVNGQELKFANTQPASNLIQWHETKARCLFLPLCYRLVPLGRILGEPSALKTSLIDGWDRGLFQGSLVYETWDLLAPSKFGMGGGDALPTYLGGVMVHAARRQCSWWSCRRGGQWKRISY